MPFIEEIIMYIVTQGRTGPHIFWYHLIEFVVSTIHIFNMRGSYYTVPSLCHELMEENEFKYGNSKYVKTMKQFISSSYSWNLVPLGSQSNCFAVNSMVWYFI